MLRTLLFLCLLAWPGKPDARYERSPDMATNIWQATTGNYDTGGNWTLGAKPANTNFVVLDGNISQQSITSGHGDESGVSIGGLWCKRSYRGDVGSPSTPWDISFDAGTYILWEGSGSLHISADTSPRVVCDSPNAVDAISLYGVESNLQARRGKIIVTATHANDVSLDVLGGSIEVRENAGWEVVNVRMSGGEVVCSRDWSATAAKTQVISGGHWQQLKNGPGGGAFLVLGGLVTWDAPGTAGRIPVLIQHGGFVDWNNTGDEKEIGLYEVYGGDFARTDQLAITTGTDFRHGWPQSIP